MPAAAAPRFQLFAGAGDGQQHNVQLLLRYYYSENYDDYYYQGCTE